MAALTSAQESLLNLLGEAQYIRWNPVVVRAASRSALTALSQYPTVDPNPINGLDGPRVILAGVNLHVRSGSGSTGDNGTPTGLGNLIVG